jgi:hypothetical protein
MTGRARDATVQDAREPSGTISGATAAPRKLAEPTLDQLFAEPMVRRLMHRDGIEEATTRRLLQQVAAARMAPRPPR